MQDHRGPYESITSIVDMCKEAVAANDESLLDLATHDYQVLLTKLAATGQHYALSDCTRSVGNALKATDLINLKGALSPKVLLKALCITNFRVSSLPSKESAKARLHNRRYEPEDSAPNAPQSMVIATSITISSKDDLREVCRAIKYFVRLGHHPATAIMIGHYLDQKMYQQDHECEGFIALSDMLTKGALHSSIAKVLNANAETWTGLCERMAAIWIEQRKKSSSLSKYSLELLEALHASGFTHQAVILGNAYDKVNWGESTTQRPCVSLRLRAIGVEAENILRQSRADANHFRSTADSVSWIEELLINENFSVEMISSEMNRLNLKSSIDRDKGFKAIQQVLEFQSTNGNQFAMNRRAILAKATEICNVIIERRNIEHNSGELKRILEEYSLPNDLSLKVHRFKGYVLERDLGL